LTNVTISNGVKSIGQDSFFGCVGLTAIIIPGSVTIIGAYAFFICTNLTNVTIRNGVANIGQGAFFGCVGLSGVTIPNSVTSIGAYAFDSCTNLTGIYFQGNGPRLGGVLSLNTNSIVYYLTGTKFWSSPAGGPSGVFGGLPAVLWNPKMQTDGVKFADMTNQFGFNITGTTNIPFVVEACTNLGGAWVSLQAVSLTNGSFYFSDPQWTNYPSRFYHLRSP
jgi:hypothetical protein